MAKLTLSNGKEIIVKQSKDCVFDKKKEAAKKGEKDIYLKQVFLSNSGEKQTDHVVLACDGIISIID